MGSGGRWGSRFRQVDTRLIALLGRRQERVLHPDGFSEHESMLLRARPLFVTSLGIVARISIWAGESSRSRHRRLLRVALVGFAASDLYRGWRLYRDGSVRVRSRLGRDLVDVALWSGVCSRDAGATAIVGVPVATEAAFRWGVVALVVPVATNTAISAARRIRGKPRRTSDVAHQVTAVLAGLGLRWLEERRVEILQARFRDEHGQAERAREHMDGRVLAFNTDIKVPEEQESLPARDVFTNILDFEDPIRTDREVKKLDDLTEPENLEDAPFAYLDPALASLRMVYNRGRGEIAEQIKHFVIEPVEGRMLVVDRTDKAVLREALEVIQPRGVVNVRVLRGGFSRRRVVVVIDGHGVDLGVRPLSAADTADAVPAGALFGALFALAQATPAADAVPLTATLPGFIGFAALAPLSHELVQQRGDAAHHSVVWLTLMASALQLVGVTRGLSSRWRPTGAPRLPAQNALVPTTMILGYCWQSLTQRQRIASSSAALLLLAHDLFWWRGDRSARRVLAFNAFASMTAGFVACHRYRTATLKEGERANKRLNELLRGECDREHDIGEREAWYEILVGCEQARRLLEAQHPDRRLILEARLSAAEAAARSRIAELDEYLDARAVADRR